MSSCDVTCPFCELEFEETDIEEIGDAEIDCIYCNQEFSVCFEAEISVEVTECTQGQEFEEKKELAKKCKYEMFMIHLNKDGANNIYYTDYGSTATHDYKKAKLFKAIEKAQRFINSFCKHKYPDAKIKTYKDCLAEENDTKNMGIFEN